MIKALLEQARELTSDELYEHYRVSKENRHSCQSCFCCACGYVYNERKEKEDNDLAHTEDRLRERFDREKS